MAEPKKYFIHLTDSEREKLKEVMKSTRTLEGVIKRCQVLLDLDKGSELTVIQIARSNEVSSVTVNNVKRIYVNGGLEAVLKYESTIRKAFRKDLHK